MLALRQYIWQVHPSQFSRYHSIPVQWLELEISLPTSFTHGIGVCCDVDGWMDGWEFLLSVSGVVQYIACIYSCWL